MKIKPWQRKKLEKYLKGFYQRYPSERYTLFHFVRYLKLRLKDNKDAWIGVSGGTGVGKSYLCIMAQILFGRPYDLQKNITYIPEGDEIMQKFNALEFNTLLIDEAAKQMRSVQWQDKQQQKVNTAAMTERFKNNAVFLNMPNFNEFTKSMKRGNIQFRAIVLYRTNTHARVIIQRRSRNWRSEDPWGDKEVNDKYKRLEKRRKEITNEILLDIERKLPNTIMDFIVPNLSLVLPEVTEEYERLKLESRGVVIEKENQSNDKYWKQKYQDLLKVVCPMTYLNTLNIGHVKVTKTMVANALSISVQTLNKYLDLGQKQRVEEEQSAKLSEN